MSVGHAKTTIDARDLARMLPEEELRKLLAHKQALSIPRERPECSPPLVSCVLVVQDMARVSAARQAVACFMRQVYARKQLVIINGVPEEEGLDTKVVTSSHSVAITEKRIAPGLSIGAMRNAGLDTAEGDWVVQWDDDDYSHPFRIAYQLAHHDGNRPVLLGRQIRVQYKSSTAFYHVETAGVAGTLMHPKTSARYPDISFREDALFCAQTWGRDCVVVHNDGPMAKMSLAFYHGRNATPEAEWMAKHSGPLGKAVLAEEDLQYLVNVCKLYGLEANLAGR